MAWSVCTATPFCKSPGPLETSRRSPSCDIHVFLALFFLLVSEKVEEKLQQLFGVGFFLWVAETAATLLGRLSHGCHICVTSKKNKICKEATKSADITQIDNIESR